MLNLYDNTMLQTILALDEKLKTNEYGSMVNYYHLLGVNLDCNKDELKNHYCELKKFIETHNNSFTEQEIQEINEGYKRFTSVLGAAWYEHNVGANGACSIQLLYDNNKKFCNMFSTLETKKKKQITVRYLEQDHDEFIEKTVNGMLNSSVRYDSILINSLNVENGMIKRIDFLGKETAIIDISDEAGKVIYNNPYLADLKKREMYNSNNMNAFRIICYNFYMAKIIDVIENADVINDDKSQKGSYTKKYGE